jgi:hypothetical protein
MMGLIIIFVYAVSGHPHQDGDSGHDQHRQRRSKHGDKPFALLVMRANLLVGGRLRRS